MFNSFGIDLGTSEVKIYNDKRKSMLTEKNMVAVRNGKSLLAVGDAAFEMLEKNPPEIEVASSVREGALFDIDRAEVLVHLLLEKSERYPGFSPALYFSAPSDRSGLEENAYYTIACAGYLKSPRVFLVDRPICDAIALGIPLSRTAGSMIVNIGAQNTDISVIAQEMVILTKSIPVGGQQINEAICDAVRREQNLLIGTRTARRLKAVLADFSGNVKEARKVSGLDLLSGLPKENVIPAELVNEAVNDRLSLLTREIRDFLERTPPQIRRNVEKEGMFLTGGTTRIPDIERFVGLRCGIRVNLSSYYDMSTIRGLEELITHKALHKWAKPVKDKA